MLHAQGRHQGNANNDGRADAVVHPWSDVLTVGGPAACLWVPCTAAAHRPRVPEPNPPREASSPISPRQAALVDAAA